MSSICTKFSASLLFYATPIFYNVETLHITNRYAQYALMANPLYSIVSMFRDCVLFGRAMNPNHIIYSAVFSVAIFAHRRAGVLQEAG